VRDNAPDLPTGAKLRLGDAGVCGLGWSGE
jgi:hypothetical protein